MDTIVPFERCIMALMCMIHSISVDTIMRVSVNLLIQSCYSVGRLPSFRVSGPWVHSICNWTILWRIEEAGVAYDVLCVRLNFSSLSTHLCRPWSNSSAVSLCSSSHSSNSDTPTLVGDPPAYFQPAVSTSNDCSQMFSLDVSVYWMPQL